MKERTSVGLDDVGLASLAVLCDLESRGRKDQVLFLIEERRKALGITDREFKKQVTAKLEEMRLKEIEATA